MWEAGVRGATIPGLHDNRCEQDRLYRATVGEVGQALARLARVHEADPERRRDLQQEIHVALWRSFARFDGRCSLRTSAFRVAHNTRAGHLRRERRGAPRPVGLDEVDEVPDAAVPGREETVDR